MELFSQLPPELLELIVASILPDDFENLALASRSLYTLLQPLVPHHNARRRQFTNFEYSKQLYSPFDLVVRTAWDLICAISAEPNIAHYIVHADLRGDSMFSRNDTHIPYHDIYRQTLAIGLIKASPFLPQVGLGLHWLMDDVSKNLIGRLPRSGYSQAAAAFILSLLPMAESLALPDWWKIPGLGDSNEEEDLTEAERFVDAVTSSAADPRHASSQRPLSRVRHVAFSGHRFPQVRARNPGLSERSLSRQVAPFLALPHLKSICARDFENRTNYSTYSNNSQMEKLEALHFEGCYFGLEPLSENIEHAKKLKVLKYSWSNIQLDYSTTVRIFETIDIIGRKLGAHLEEFSFTVEWLRGGIKFKNFSMSIFSNLRKLELDLKIVTWVMDERYKYSQRTKGTPQEAPEKSVLCPRTPLLGALVPRTVTELSLTAKPWWPPAWPSRTASDYCPTIDALFTGFSIKKAALVPELGSIYLDSADDAGHAYEAACHRAHLEVEQTDATMHIRTRAKFIVPAREIYEMDWDYSS